MKNCKYKIFYIGLHPDTLVFLSKEPSFILCGANFLEYFFSFKTWNPVNYIFKLLYCLRVKNKYRPLELLLLKLFCFLENFSSSVAYKYRNYTKILSRRRIDILNDEDAKTFEEYIKKEKIDLAVVNYWGLLPSEIVLAPRLGTLNIHPSKLPQYRGSLPTLWTLKNNDDKSAVSYILINDKIDGGKIISQHSFDVAKNDIAISLERKIDKIIEKTLIEDMKKYIKGEIVPSEQDLNLKSGTAKYGEYREIDWKNEKVRDIYNKITLYPFSEPEIFCYFYFGKRKIEIKNAEFVENQKISDDTQSGDFAIKKMDILFQVKDGIIKCRLFGDVGFWDSIVLIIKKDCKIWG